MAGTSSQIAIISTTKAPFKEQTEATETTLVRGVDQSWYLEDALHRFEEERYELDGELVSGQRRIMTHSKRKQQPRPGALAKVAVTNDRVRSSDFLGLSEMSVVNPVGTTPRVDSLGMRGQWHYGLRG
jgi:hypothetical protein